MAANDWTLHDSVPPFQGFAAPAAEGSWTMHDSPLPFIGFAAAPGPWIYDFSPSPDLYLFIAETAAVVVSRLRTLVGIGT